MAFRQESRKTVACCRSTLHRRSWVLVSHLSAQHKSNDDLMVQHDLCAHGISGRILGDSNVNPQRIHSRGCSGNDQRAGERGRVCWTLRVWVSAHANWIFRRRICGPDVLCACGGDLHVIDASHAPARSQICRIELTSAQMQFLFDFLHKLLRRSAQLNC